MLRHLRARNLGVLEDAQIDPGDGFTVITGETGAGKTLLLGALRLLLGERPRGDGVGPFADSLQADGLFERDGAEIGVSRTIPADGRSRAYLEGSLVSAAVLEAEVGPLVEIVAQHDQLRLRRPGAILAMVDGALSRVDEAGHLATYGEAWSRHRAALASRDELGGDLMALERQRDLVAYQATEIEAAALGPDEDEAVEALALRLRNAEAIRGHLAVAVSRSESISDAIGDVVSSLRKAAELDPAASDLAARAEALAEEVTGMAREARAAAEEALEDPAALAAAEDRLTLIGDLRRKYGKTIEEVVRFGEEARGRAVELDDLLGRASGIDAEVDSTWAGVVKAGEGLSQARQEAATLVAAEAMSHLRDLGMPAASLSIELEPYEPGPNGADRAALMFSSDGRVRPGKVEEVASGGELSRLVLSIRLATTVEGVETLVFDEVDSGVGGATALALGRKLAELGKRSQVLCVTHLPQVAAHADTHYVVRRDDRAASVTAVDGEERVEELARMLAGLPESIGSREAAIELLEAAHGDGRRRRGSVLR